jgi:hypothetical protein
MPGIPGKTGQRERAGAPFLSLGYCLVIAPIKFAAPHHVRIIADSAGYYCLIRLVTMRKSDCLVK